MDEAGPTFLDVPSLIEHSLPQRRQAWFKFAIGGFLLLVLGSAYLRSQSAHAQVLVEIGSAVAMFGLIGVMTFVTMTAMRSQRAEQNRLAAIEELLQLRRWPQAATLLNDMLSRPTRSPQARVHALIFLASVLARYHRFADAITVQEHLLEFVTMDDGTSHALRLGRAMAMLREDRLFDADRAISELRRGPFGDQSAGSALIEIYRDVKTGHPAEAIEIFDAKLSVLREQLGHRVADAWALISKAYDLLGRDTEAARAYENATLLAPVIELQRRYPEVTSLAEKYQPSSAPAEAM